MTDDEPSRTASLLLTGQSKRRPGKALANREHVDDLALFANQPIFTEPLHVGRPNVGRRESFLRHMTSLLDRLWFTNNGPLVQEMESRIADRLGVKHCIAMCNATVGLEIAIRAVEMRGEVIIPAYTFIATAHALQWQEITPVFCDIEATTHNIDPEKVENLITPRTSGIIGVHLWGRPCNVDALSEIAEKHRLRLMFDAAHAFGCSYKGRMVGTFGDAEILSFHATKFLNTFEGGAVVTNNDDIAQRIRLMKNFGFSGYDNVIYIGTNGKMSEASAAMGLTNLESVDEFVTKNRQNYHVYKDAVSDIRGLKLLKYDEKEQCNYQYIVVEVDESVAGVSRDDLVRVLQAENILARKYFWPGCHRMQPYRSYFPNAGLVLEQTKRIAQRVMVLPTGTSVNEEEIVTICHIVKLCIEKSTDLRRRLDTLRA